MYPGHDSVVIYTPSAAQGLRILGPASLGGEEAIETPLTHPSLPQGQTQPIEFPLLVIGQSWTHALL